MYEHAQFNNKLNKDVPASYHGNRKDSNVKVNEKLLHKWERKNKHQFNFSPNPYTIENIKGSMITATNENNHTITRDIGDFRKFNLLILI